MIRLFFLPERLRSLERRLEDPEFRRIFDVIVESVARRRETAAVGTPDLWADFLGRVDLLNFGGAEGATVTLLDAEDLLARPEFHRIVRRASGEYSKFPDFLEAVARELEERKR